MNSLVCLGKILEYLDKWFVLDDILPFLQQIPSKEPAVLMGILGNEYLISLLVSFVVVISIWHIGSAVCVPWLTIYVKAY